MAAFKQGELNEPMEEDRGECLTLTAYPFEIITYNTGVSFFNISSKFVQTLNFVPSDTEVHQSFGSGLDSSQHRSLHRAFRSLLTDGTNL